MIPLVAISLISSAVAAFHGFFNAAIVAHGTLHANALNDRRGADDGHDGTDENSSDIHVDEDGGGGGVCAGVVFALGTRWLALT